MYKVVVIDDSTGLEDEFEFDKQDVAEEFCQKVLEEAVRIDEPCSVCTYVMTLVRQERSHAD